MRPGWPRELVRVLAPSALGAPLRGAESRAWGLVLLPGLGWAPRLVDRWQLAVSALAETG